MKRSDVNNGERGAGEARLIARIAAGDPVALAHAFESHADRLYRIAIGITGSAADAEDVVHDVFVGLPEALARFEGRSTLATWLHRVTVRAALLRVRRSRRRAAVLIRLALEWSDAADSDTAVDRVALERALAAMPASHRHVLWLKLVDGWTHAEIAETLGITENASCQRLHRARKLVRKALGEDT